MALSLLFIELRIPIWPRLAKDRATSRVNLQSSIYAVTG